MAVSDLRLYTVIPVYVLCVVVVRCFYEAVTPDRYSLYHVYIPMDRDTFSSTEPSRTDSDITIDDVCSTYRSNTSVHLTVPSSPSKQ